MNMTIFNSIPLDEQHSIYISRPKQGFSFSADDFEKFWKLHPTEYHTIKIHGKEIQTPRWQQAYGADYRYTGARNNALPITKELKAIQSWCWEQINPSFNALLLNWYDGSQGHYIGAHRDDTRDLIEGSSIVTISLGETRVFRMRPWKGKGFKDFSFPNGAIIVIPWATNLKWTHEVPKAKRYQGKRISITLRSFSNALH